MAAGSPEGINQAWDVARNGNIVMLQAGAQETSAHTSLSFIFNWFDEIHRLPSRMN